MKHYFLIKALLIVLIAGSWGCSNNEDPTSKENENPPKEIKESEEKNDEEIKEDGGAYVHSVAVLIEYTDMKKKNLINWLDFEIISITDNKGNIFNPNKAFIMEKGRTKFHLRITSFSSNTIESEHIYFLQLLLMR